MIPIFLVLFAVCGAETWQCAGMVALAAIGWTWLLRATIGPWQADLLASIAFALDVDRVGACIVTLGPKDERVARQAGVASVATLRAQLARANLLADVLLHGGLLALAAAAWLR